MKLSLLAKRSLALASVAAARCVAIGCWIDGRWWYDWMYEGNFKHPEYALAGFKYFLNSSFHFVVVVFVAIFLAFVLGSTWKAHLYRVVDKFVGLITFTGVWMLALTFAIVYHAYNSVEPDYWEQHMNQVQERVSSEIQHVTSLPAVQTPIDFHYVDSDKINALYSQLEPELIEKQRTVADTASGRAKVGIDAGPANVEAGIENGKASTSSYSRTDFSPDRKCIVVMQDVVEKNRAKYYTTSEAWMGTQRTIEAMLKAQEDQLTELAKYYQEAVRRRADPHKAVGTFTLEVKPPPGGLLQYELKNLQGLVFVDSVFDTQANGNATVLIAEFSPEPERVFFRVNVAKSAKLDVLRKARLRVFGDVTRGLTNNGYVDIQAIAIY